MALSYRSQGPPTARPGPAAAVATTPVTTATTGAGTSAAQGGRITVELSDGRTVAATVVGTGQATDLAVIHAQGVSGLKAATFSDSDALEVGDTVLAVGNSGGPLVDAAGRVVGITTANASVDGQSSGSIGVGFAIPGNRVEQIVRQLTGGGARTVSASATSG